MSNKSVILGLNDNAICFDFDGKMVYFFRKGWASKTLKLVNIAIPFEKITAIELIKPVTWSAGKISLIVDGNRLLAEDKFENNASELSLDDSIYPNVYEVVSRLRQECPDIKLETEENPKVPKTKNQKDYATTLTYEEFIKNCDIPAGVVKTKGVSIGEALLVLAAGLVCIYFLFKFLG